jgi:hypothetical protein
MVVVASIVVGEGKSDSFQIIIHRNKQGKKEKPLVA